MKYFDPKPRPGSSPSRKILCSVQLISFCWLICSPTTVKKKYNAKRYRTHIVYPGNPWVAPGLIGQRTSAHNRDRPLTLPLLFIRTVKLLSVNKPRDRQAERSRSMKGTK